jgi:hypothetical protein
MPHNMVQSTIEELTLPGIVNVDGVAVLTLTGDGNVLLCLGTTAPSGKAGYAVGGKFVNTSTGAHYINTGTTASCSFVIQTTTPAATVTGAMLTAKKGYFTVAVNTNGTTPVNVFGAGGAPVALTITSITSTALDTTTGNIITKQAANTVATIAKGATAGALVGAVSLANATYAAADVCTVESSSAGNSTVLITFTVA